MAYQSGHKESFDCSCIEKIPKKQREGQNTGQHKCNLSNILLPYVQSVSNLQAQD